MPSSIWTVNALEFLHYLYLPDMTCLITFMERMIVTVYSFIISRDLKPANLLLGDRGHLLITHFSNWSHVEQQLDFSAMDMMYVAPEVSVHSSTGSNAEESCDWWSVGALLYELITGRTLVSNHPAGITTHLPLYVPDHVSPEATSLLEQLLKVCPTERLGVEDIKTHAFFNGIDFAQLEKY